MTFAGLLVETKSMNEFPFRQNYRNISHIQKGILLNMTTPRTNNVMFLTPLHNKHLKHQFTIVLESLGAYYWHLYTLSLVYTEEMQLRNIKRNCESVNNLNYIYIIIWILLTIQYKRKCLSIIIIDFTKLKAVFV